MGVGAEGRDVVQLRSGPGCEHKADIHEGFCHDLQLPVSGEGVECGGHAALNRVLHGHNGPGELTGGYCRKHFVHAVCGNALRVRKTALGD